MTSQFDPDTFLDGVTTDAGTRRPPLPPGDYIATIGEIKAQHGQQKKDTSKTWYALNIPLEVDLSAYPAAMQMVGQPKVTLFHFVGLDVNASGALDWSAGKNSRLTRYREVLGLNIPGEAFSPRMMTGRMVLVKVGQETYEDEVRDTVAGVAKAA